MAAADAKSGVCINRNDQIQEDSSESEADIEPAESFRRQLSTNRDIKHTATTKEGFLLKQTWSFQRWRRRYFKLRGRTLYYAKDPKALIFDEIDLADLIFAECSIKNINNSFQVITPFRRLVLASETRVDMDEWLSALKAANSRECYEGGEHHDLLSGCHHWYATSHARPTYCNVCREALSGVTSHGLSCEVCKCKVHKRCAAKAICNCKWTTLASVGKDIIEDEDGNITMPHQWMEGNLPVSAKCAVCDRTCGSVLRLQDWRCLWCRATAHTACRPNHPVHCPLGPSRVSVVPPTALHSVGSDEAWEAVRPQGCSPLLVFVNSKSGDNQGVRFLRRFKQLLNPAQVFDLIAGGPGLGLGLFRHFDPFRILVCSGDGSVGWVLSEIDRLHMHKQCQVGVLPLGTGNDLARVLGWGSSCDDDTHLPQLLDKYEKASTKMLDRWSIMAFERSIAIPERKLSTDNYRSMSAYEDSVVSHLTKILQSDHHSTVISSAKVLCETVKDFTTRAAEISVGQGDQQFSDKCQLLKDKLDLLLQTMHVEEENVSMQETLDLLAQSLHRDDRNIPEVNVEGPDGEEKCTLEKQEKEFSNMQRTTRSGSIQPREESSSRSLMSRANSLKRAVRQLVEYTEQAVDDQNKAATTRRDSVVAEPRRFLDIPGQRQRSDSLKVPTMGQPVCDSSPCPSPSALTTSDFTYLSISPLPDLRRDSTGCDDLLTSLPVPTAFADGRRSLTLADDEEIKRFLPIAPSPASLDQSDSTETTENTVRARDIVDSLRVQELKDSMLSPLCTSLSSYSDKYSLMEEKSLMEGLDFENVCLITSDIRLPEDSNGSDRTDDEMVLTASFDAEIGEFVLKQISSSESINVRSFEAPDYGDVGQDRLMVGMPYQHIRSQSLVPSSGLEDKPSGLARSTSVMCFDADIAHIDSPETSDPTLNSPTLIKSELGDNNISVIGESTVQDDTSSILGLSSSLHGESSLADHECSGTEMSSSLENCDTFKTSTLLTVQPTKRPSLSDEGDDEKPDEPSEEVVELVKGCSLAHFSEGSDIGRKSFYRHVKSPKPKTGLLKATLETPDFEGPKPRRVSLNVDPTIIEPRHLDVVNIQIQGSNGNICLGSTSDVSDRDDTPKQGAEKKEMKRKQSFGGEFRINREASVEDGDKDFPAVISFVVDPPSPGNSPEGRHPLQMEDDIVFRRPSIGKLSPSTSVFGLSCSPAATRRISTCSLLKAPDGTPAVGRYSISERAKSIGLSDDQRRRLPIINPLVRLPMWPNVSSGAGLISKVLLANADALCAAASPLMDPDETLLEGYYERSVMNNYFGIGIDAKISLDFHQKREEHPEKCRSRAKNYMWYGVLGSKEWLQKTYKNLEQRVQLECDGQRIPLPSLQGIVILNIPSFMGGTNFWGGTKEDDCFLAPSFDDRILEVVAVFGSVQMAASRLINLQHHRIAQCSSVQITILGEEGVPIQVDGEAWVQPPGMIRIIHKNRMQMLCRNRSLETSLKTWEEKQKLTTTTTQSAAGASGESKTSPFSFEENQLLLSFIESSTTLVKYVKLLTISHPSIEPELYQLAAITSAHMEKVHPGGKIVEGPNLRPQVTELVSSARQLYEEACNLLREKAHSLRLREDLEGKLSSALGNMEMELRKCVTYDSVGLVHFQQPSAEEQNESRKARASRGLSWLKFRRGHSGMSRGTRDVNGWGVVEVCAWLDSLGLAEYSESFTRHDVRGREVLTLGRRDLKELGVTKVGHVKRILQGVRDLTM